jgi:hypothetical protein
MMDEADDRANSQFTQPCQLLVGPGPIGSIKPIWRDPLPEDGIPDRLDPKVGKQVEVFRPVHVPQALKLLEVGVTDPV